MTLAELIAKIQKLKIEDTDANILAQEVKDLFQNQQKENDTKVSQLNDKIDTLTAAIGIDSGTTEEKLIVATNKLTTLTKENETLTAKNQELTTKIANSERADSVRQAARVAGVEPTVLNTLLGEEKLTIDGNKVLVGDKELKTWAEANHQPFLSALYPESSTQTETSNTETKNKFSSAPPHNKSESTNPGTNSHGKNEESYLVDDYLGKRYKAPSFAMSVDK